MSLPKIEDRPEKPLRKPRFLLPETAEKYRDLMEKAAKAADELDMEAEGEERKNFIRLVARRSEKKLRQEEQWDILTRSGALLMSETAPSDKKEIALESSRRPRIWDKVERRLITYRGGHFVCQVRYPAVIREGGSHYNPIYYPAGFHGERTIDWMSKSVSQMTDEERRMVLERLTRAAKDHADWKKHHPACASHQ